MREIHSKTGGEWRKDLMIIDKRVKEREILREREDGFREKD